MPKFTFQFIETTTYKIEVEDDDQEAAEDKARELFENETSDMYEQGTHAELELITNHDTGESIYCL